MNELIQPSAFKSIKSRKLLNSEIEGVSCHTDIELLPQSLEELQSIVVYCWENRQSFSVVSTGCNWGLGQKYSNSSYLVNLESLNQLCLNEDTGVIYAQSGVTQNQICKLLKEKDSDYFFDVTGSSLDSSLVGNCLERGISYNSQRVDSVIHFDLLLKDGSLAYTGLGDGKSLFAQMYSQTTGPGIKDLVYQSELAVVTGVYYQLKKRPEYQESIQLKLKDESQLIDLVSPLRYLMQNNFVDGIPHIANTQRARQSLLSSIQEGAQEPIALSKTSWNFLEVLLGSEGSWTGIMQVRGTKKEVSLKIKQIKKQLRRDFTYRVIQPWKLKIIDTLIRIFPNSEILRLLQGIRKLDGLSRGAASNAALGSITKDNMSFKTKDEFDVFLNNSDQGFLYILPLFYFNKEKLSLALSLVKENLKFLNEDPAITFNPLSQNVAELVISIRFEKNTSALVHKSLRELEDLFEKNDIWIYRQASYSKKRKADRDKTLEILKKIVDTNL